MRQNKLALYVHFVWTTWDRLPLIKPEIERNLYRNIESEARTMGCVVLALNGTQDHIHLVLSIPATVTVAQLAKQIKGVSSHFVNNTLQSRVQFKWQGGYGAFTVSRWDLERVIGYVNAQKQHHAKQDIWEELETSFQILESMS